MEFNIPHIFRTFHLQFAKRGYDKYVAAGVYKYVYIKCAVHIAMHAFRMYALQCIDSLEINKNMLWVGYILYSFLVNKKNTMVLIFAQKKT